MTLGMSRDLMLFWRFLLASPLLWAWSRLQEKNHSHAASAFSKAFFLGVVGIGIEASLFFIAVQLLGAGLSNVIFYTYPAFTAVLMRLFFKEKLPFEKWIFLGICLCSLGLLVEPSDLNFNLKGLGVALLMAFWYAIYMITGTRVTKNLPPLLTSTFVSTGACFAFAALAISKSEMRLPMVAEWPLVIGLAIASTVIPFGFLYMGLNKIGATKTAFIATSEMVFTVLMAYAFLGEQFSLKQGLGALGIGISVLLLSSAAPKIKQNDRS